VVWGFLIDDDYIFTQFDETADSQLPEKECTRRMMLNISRISLQAANEYGIRPQSAANLFEWEKKLGRPYVPFCAHVATTVSFHRRKRLITEKVFREEWDDRGARLVCRHK
jgi:hypothetical protein